MAMAAMGNQVPENEDQVKKKTREASKAGKISWMQQLRGMGLPVEGHGGGLQFQINKAKVDGFSKTTLLHVLPHQRYHFFLPRI